MSPAAIRSRWILATATMLATLLYAIDATIVNVALPHMQGSLQATQDQAAWIVTAYIVVSAIAPGAFASDMNKDARDHGEEVKARIPAGRIGEPEDMAAAAIYLASRAGDYVMGSTLVVDGGITHAR